MTEDCCQQADGAETFQRLKTETRRRQRCGLAEAKFVVSLPTHIAAERLAPHSMNPKLNILFVCALNKKRSVTAERLFRDDPRVAVRSAGVRTEAPRRINAADLAWADVVFAMEREHKQWIQTRFRDMDLPPIDVLDIPDDYEVMDPKLLAILMGLVGPEIEHRLSR